MIVFRKNSGRNRGGDSSGPGPSGASTQIPPDLEVVRPERSVHGQDLFAVHPPDGPALGHVPTDGGQGHLPFQFGVRDAYERYCAVAHTVGRPDAASSATRAAPESAPAEEEVPRRRQLGCDDHAPVQIVAVGLHAQEGPCVHGAAR